MEHFLNIHSTSGELVHFGKASKLELCMSWNGEIIQAPSDNE